MRLSFGTLVVPCKLSGSQQAAPALALVTRHCVCMFWGYKGDRGQGCLLIYHLWKFEVGVRVSREPCTLSRNTLFFPSSGRREIGTLYCPCCPPELVTTFKSKTQEAPSQRHGIWLSSSPSELLLDGVLMGLSPPWLFPVNRFLKREVTSERLLITFNALGDGTD